MPDSVTLSKRVPEIHMEIVEDIISSTGVFDDKSEYSRFADMYVAEQLFAQEIDQPEYSNIKQEFGNADRRDLYNGVERYFAGLLAEDESLVDEGGQMISQFDSSLGDMAAKYAEKFEKIYWG